MEKQPLIIYGLQRTGTNYLESLIPKNFSNFELINDGAARSLPVHKHFRLYDDMNFIPEPKYYNNFHYDSLSDLEEHLESITGKHGIKFIIAVRNPYNWYLSYCRLARKNTRLFKRSRWPHFNRHSENPQFMIDYNLFYQKWLTFIKANPDKTILIRHEDNLQNLEKSLNRIEQKFGLNRKSEKIENPGKVNMSKKFTEQKRTYYVENKFIEEYDKKELEILTEHLDEKLITELGYDLVKP